MPERLSVDLVLGSESGRISTSIYASITEEGDVRVTGQDFGPGASITGGDETEYIASVAREYKDLLLRNLLMEAHPEEAFDDPAGLPEEKKNRLVLALLEKRYRGNERAVEELYAFARSKDIPARWFRWP